MRPDTSASNRKRCGEEHTACQRIAQDGATNPDGDELRVAWNDDLIKIYKNHESVHESGCFKVALLASFSVHWVPPYHWFSPLTT